LKKLVSDKRVNINAPCKHSIYGNWTALHFACFRNLKECASILFEQENLDVNATSDTQQSVLIVACSSQTGLNHDLVEKLLDLGADVNACDEHKYTALMMASSRGKIHSVSLLLKQESINVNALDKFGHNALVRKSIF